MNTRHADDILDRPCPEELALPPFFALDRDKRESILAAAKAEFARHGYARASTNRIVKDCGIAKGSLFNYFAGKDGLFLYLHWLAAKAQLEHVKARMEMPSTDAVDALARAIEAGLDFLAESPADYALAQTMAAPDAGELVGRYRALFGDEDAKTLFASFVAPDDPGLADLLFWTLGGVKLEIQARMRAGADPRDIAADMRARLEVARRRLLASAREGR